MSNKSNRPPGHLSIITLAIEWNCTEKFIRQLLGEGMPSIKIKGKRYMDLAECQRWYRGYAW